MMPFANIAFGFWIETVAFDRKPLGINAVFPYLSKSSAGLRANPDDQLAAEALRSWRE